MKRGPQEQDIKTPSAKRPKHNLETTVPLQEEKAIHLSESGETPSPLLWCGVAKKAYPEAKLTALRQKQWDEIQYIKNHWNETLAGINRTDWAELDAIRAIAEDMGIYEEREALLDRLNGDRIRIKIQASINNGEHELLLMFMNLTRLPNTLLLDSDLSRFWQSLKSLNLTTNNFDHIPTEIKKLYNLETLLLSGNKITNLPKEIGQLKKLTHLYLSGNLITYLPSEIGKLRKLRSLFLQENQLTCLPVEISNLEKLRTLSLSKNNLKCLPVEIAALNELIYLFIEGNQLTELPNELIQKFGEHWIKKTLESQKQPDQAVPDAAPKLRP